MSARPEAPSFPPRALESPGVPERTGSHPSSFVPVPFGTKPRPSYPQRVDYANFDPANLRQSFAMGPVPLDSPPANARPNAPTSIEHRAGSEPHTGWRRQNIDVDTRHNSIPPSLETALLTFRQRLPYPTRTTHEMTTWMPPPIAEPRRYGSQPITKAERLAARHSDWPNDWVDWAEENDPHVTRWVGYDRHRHAMSGGREEPNETAAVPNQYVLESIEIEGDPLVALRRTAKDSQDIIKRENDRRIDLEDEIRRLEQRNDIVEDDNEAYRERNGYLERSRQEARDNLTLTEQERDLLRRHRDLARNQAERLRVERDELAEAYSREQQEHEQAIVRLRDLQWSEATLRAELEAATTRADQLQTEQDRLEDDREQMEMERDHYWTERDRQRDQNQDLQEQVRRLVTQLRAAQAVAVPPLVIPPPVNAPLDVPPSVGPPPVALPPIVPHPVAAPPVVAHQVIAHPVGLVGGHGRGHGKVGARGRGGRGGRGAATATRKQPGRSCKVNKDYRK
ncbi:MAG: hypothetical protein Q9175_006188 [Cornicularia normoerica]